MWRFNFFNGGRPPSWICWARIGTTNDDYLVVSIVVQNLVEVDGVVSIIWNFTFNFLPFGLKTPIRRAKLGFLGIHPPNWEQYQRNPQKAHPCASSCRLSHQAWKSVDGCDLLVSCRKKGISKKISLYFTHSPRSPPWTDLHQIWQSHRSRRRNH